MTTKITLEVLEGYLNCKTKAHLKLAGQQGKRVDYESLLSSTRQEARQQAIDMILAKHSPRASARGTFDSYSRYFAGRFCRSY